MNYRLVSAKNKDIELLTGIKMVTMLDDEMDKKLSFKEKEKIKNNIVTNIEQTYKDYKVILVDKEIAGAYVVIPYKNGIMIDELFLFPEFRNKGLGTEIVQNIICGCRYLYVWLYKNNKEAIKFFEKLGFDKIVDGRTLVYRYDNIQKKVLDVMSNIRLGYRDKAGNKFIEPDRNFRDGYYLQKNDEILNNNFGLVFEQVELERELVNKLGIDFRTYFMIYNTTDNEMSHSFLVYKDNDKYYWLENAWLKYRGIHEYDTKEDLLKDVVRKFVSTIKDSDEKKVRLYQFVKPKVGINYDKYVKNAMSGIKISLFKGN